MSRFSASYTAPTLTPETYLIFCHIAAAPASQTALEAATRLPNRSVGRRLAQLRKLKLVEYTQGSYHLSQHGRGFLEQDS